MGVRLSDLPPAVRRRVEEQHGTSPRSGSGGGKTRADRGPWATGSCATCGWQGDDRHGQCTRDACDCFHRHMAETGHHRWEAQLT